jgi:3-dehydroquinate synthase
MNKFSIDNKQFNVCPIKKDKLLIQSHPKNYEVLFKEFNISDIKNTDVILIDKNIKNLYKIDHINTIEIEATENNKNIDTVLNVCEKLLSLNFDKGNTLYVIGGGIIQDLGAFISKIFKRGINWIYIPTTLLSQCDSCIGGKTALNFKNYKNQLALFSAPNQVIIDIKFLKTLSEKDITSGYGEIIKLFLMGGIYYIDNLEKFDLSTAIFHSLSIKKAVVEYDEFEKNERKSMNYGHSFGHAIESITNYSIPHGEAVLLGIELINRLFTKSSEITNIVSRFTDFNKLKGIQASKILEILKTDKKVMNEILSFVVLKEIGNTIFIKEKINNNLGERLNEIFID